MTARSLGPFTTVSEDPWEARSSVLAIYSLLLWTLPLSPSLVTLSVPQYSFQVALLLPRPLAQPCGLCTAQLQGVLFVSAVTGVASSRGERPGPPMSPCTALSQVRRASPFGPQRALTQGWFVQ